MARETTSSAYLFGSARIFGVSQTVAAGASKYLWDFESPAKLGRKRGQSGNRTQALTDTALGSLESVCLQTPVCSSSSSSSSSSDSASGGGGTVAHRDVCLRAGARASAQFFVFVGVLVMLYCLAALVIYIFFDDLYRKDHRVIIGDFVASVVLTALWLVSSAVWAAGVVAVKGVTDPVQGGLFDHPRFPDCLPAAHRCYLTVPGNFGSLNASVIFGFFNMLVWLGNLWFLYKETPWFKIQSKPPAGGLRRPSDLPLQLDIDLDPHKV
ncbi:synaptoporin-like [Babylonia areolata]|uniref:synaptoporin-like n=1 Tax=Babylonia areolata TaxID=304850 RepID=UPI003FD2D9B0